MLHPRYRSSGTDNDFGLIFLRGSASADAELVRLNERSAVPATGESVTVMGWGDTLASESASRPSNTLKEAELQVVSNRRCAQASGWVGFSYSSYRGAITDNMLCAQDRGEDSCQVRVPGRDGVSAARGIGHFSMFVAPASNQNATIRETAGDRSS